VLRRKDSGRGGTETKAKKGESSQRGEQASSFALDTTGRRAFSWRERVVYGTHDHLRDDDDDDDDDAGKK